MTAKKAGFISSAVYNTASYYGGPIGPPATIGCELRQARKGATVAIDSCAGMWLVGSPPSSFRALLCSNLK